MHELSAKESTAVLQGLGFEREVGERLGQTAKNATLRRLVDVTQIKGTQDKG